MKAPLLFFYLLYSQFEFNLELEEIERKSEPCGVAPEGASRFEIEIPEPKYLNNRGTFPSPSERPCAVPSLAFLRRVCSILRLRSALSRVPTSTAIFGPLSTLAFGRGQGRVFLETSFDPSSFAVRNAYIYSGRWAT